MYSIELPNRETLDAERETLGQILATLPEHQKSRVVDNVVVIHQKFSEGLNKIQEIAETLEQLDTNTIQCEDLSTPEKVGEFRDINLSKIRQFRELEKVINELLKISVNIYDLTNSLSYLPPNQKEFSTRIIKRFEDFQRAIKEDLPELQKLITEQIEPYIVLQYKLASDKIWGIPGRDFPDDGVTGARIIGQNTSQSIQKKNQLRQMHEQEKKFSPNFRRLLRGVASVIAVVTLWFAGDSGRGTMADIDTPMPAASAAASPSPYASPSATERKVDFSRMPTSQFVEISTLPTGQIMVQNKEGKTLTLNNVGGNKWISSDGNQYISFKYPYGTKNFFTPVRTSTTAKPNPSPSAASPLPSASASPYASPTASPSESPRATSSSGAPEFDFTKETPGTLKFYIEDSDGITAIGYDGNGAILKPIKEFGPGVFRSAGGKLYNKKISQKSIIFVPR